MEDALLIAVISIALTLTGFYLIIKLALKETLVKEARRTNELLIDILRSNGAHVDDMLTKEEKERQIVLQQRVLFNRMSRGEIDQATFDAGIRSLQGGKMWAK